MLLKDVPWVPYSEANTKRWLREADIMKPNGVNLRIWEGECDGQTEYAMYPHFGEGNAHGYGRERKLKLDALEAQCLLFYYLGGN